MLKNLKTIAPHGKDFILKGIEDHSNLLNQYQIDTPLRETMFMAQIAHESAGFTTTTEFASGAAYEGRTSLGNNQPGDGVRYKGRGLIQLTGKYNYKRFSNLLNIDLLNRPGLVATFPLALEVSCLFWKLSNCNGPADQCDIEKVTKKINGGLNGLTDRVHWFDVFKKRYTLSPEIKEQV